MAITQEMFRFVTTRGPERVIMSRINSRLIRDRREVTRSSLLVTLFGPGDYPSKLREANAFAASADFLNDDDPAIIALEPAVDFFRTKLAPDVSLAQLATDFEASLPLLAALLKAAPPRELLEATARMVGRLWDSIYAQTIRGCDRYVTTNYLADGLRVYHILRLLWLSRKLQLANWAGGAFDEYEVLIDLNAAIAGAAPADDAGPDNNSLPVPQQFQQLQNLTQQIVATDQVVGQIRGLVQRDELRVVESPAGTKKFLDAQTAQALRNDPALRNIDLEQTPVDQVLRTLQTEYDHASLLRQRIFASMADQTVATEFESMVNDALVARPPANPTAANLVSLADGVGKFRVPLSVGAIQPPVVGDLILVEQELRRYELGELADIESIMQGERRERTIRNLARTTQTTSTETSSEQESSNSLTTDERFQLSSQAQKTASEGFGVEAGVNVSGKFGPVQVGASVNASYNTSQSTTESTSQDYAKTVTEQATRRVQDSIKQTSSITILTETQNNSLRGFNNEKGTSHVNGLYRWVDKIYTARLMNYGRRLMLSLKVPEPAAFYRGLLTQNETALLADLEEPLPPSRISRTTLEPLPDSNTTGGFLSFEDITEDNYAQLAALYGVTGLQPPPPEYLTGSKAFVYPDAMQASEIKPHDQVNELTYVSVDNTLTLDPNYRLKSIAVYAGEGATGELGSYADALKLGEVAKPSRPSDGTKVSEADLVLVQVANLSFYLSVRRDPDDSDQKLIKTNFNTWQQIGDEWAAFGELVQPAIPVAITAKFEGVLTFTVMYQGYRLSAAYDAWKSQTYAAIIKGYTAKQQAYDQALALAEAQGQSGTESQTFQLRDDQYRSIELTELKRGCIDLLTEGTAAGHTSIAVAADGTPSIVYDKPSGGGLPRWRSPLVNGAVAEFFEVAFEWPETTYEFYPYYWAAKKRWKDLAQASASDPVFEQFLRAGSASVVVPVRPGYERSVILFLKTGLIWAGRYLPLFTSQDMLDVYADVELGVQLDPPEQVGDSWEIRLPTSLAMLQEGDELPEFPEETDDGGEPATMNEPVPDATVPF